jgi:MoaA/NifB/PqqE/SkfB family radical SAM enzyme
MQTMPDREIPAVSPRPRVSASPRRKVDIIFNLTLVCQWDCEVCCVDAIHVQRKNGHAVLRSEGLTKETRIPIKPGDDNVYELAYRHRAAQGLELTFEHKKRAIDNLEGFDARVDISGGDALLLRDNFQILKYASERLGKSNVSLTATGAGSSHYSATQLAPLVDEYNFTFDAESAFDVANRPSGYALGNLKKAEAFVKLGAKTRAELPLTKSIMSEDHLARVYKLLHQKGIGKLLLMRLFPVGRGSGLPQEIPSPADYRRTIEAMRRLEAVYKTPVLKLQCALKHLTGEPLANNFNPCDLVHESFGLMADGTLLASPWAINGRGRPLDPVWILGNLAQTPLGEILASEKALEYKRRADENFGHCKIFSYLHGTSPRKMDRLFENADPLYAAPAPGTTDVERLVPLQARQLPIAV